MRLSRALASLLLIPLVLSGCPDRTISSVKTTQEGEVKKDIPVSADVDILFVIDSSASTTDKQTVFAANFPKFVQALDAFPTGRPNIHIGVVSTTVDIHTPGFGPGCPSPAPNDDGLLQNTPRVAGCTHRMAGSSATSRTPRAHARRTTPARSSLRCRASRSSAPPVAASRRRSRR